MDFPEVITVFDWISPLLQIKQNIFGGMTTIIATVPGKTGREVEQTLNIYGVQTGTAMIVDGELLIPVDDIALADWVLGLLRYS